MRADGCLQSEVPIGLPGEDNSHDAGIQLPDARKKFGSVHAGHPDIRNDHVEWIARHDFERLGTAAGEFQVPLVAHGVEETPDTVEHSGFVVDKNNPRHAASISTASGSRMMNVVPLPGFGLKPNGAAMLLHDYSVRDSQTLPRALTDRLGGEEGVEYFRLVCLGNAATRIAHPDLNGRSVAAGGDVDPAHAAGILHHIGNRVSGVHDEVQDHLIELPGQAGYRRQFRIEIRRELGQVFPFAPRNQNGALDGAIDVHRHLLDRPRMREFLHGEHDARDMIDSFEQLFDGFGNFVAEVIEDAFVQHFPRGNGYARRIGNRLFAAFARLSANFTRSRNASSRNFPLSPMY